MDFPFSTPVIATACGDHTEPEIGPCVPGPERPRVVVGWGHQNNTKSELVKGRIWGWSSEDNYHFQVYDESFNRSLRPGVMRCCGPANFTMIRMFHPYFCPGGAIPRDGVSDDKRRCRILYNRLMAQRNTELDLPVNPDMDLGENGSLGGKTMPKCRGKASGIGQHRSRSMRRYGRPSIARAKAEVIGQWPPILKHRLNGFYQSNTVLLQNEIAQHERSADARIIDLTETAGDAPETGILIDDDETSMLLETYKLEKTSDSDSEDEGARFHPFYISDNDESDFIPGAMSPANVGSTPKRERTSTPVGSPAHFIPTKIDNNDVSKIVRGTVETSNLIA